MTRRESIEATIYALLFMMDKAKEDAKRDNGAAAAIVQALPIAIEALKDELMKEVVNGYS